MPGRLRGQEAAQICYGVGHGENSPSLVGRKIQRPAIAILKRKEIIFLKNLRSLASWNSKCVETNR